MKTSEHEYHELGYKHEKAQQQNKSVYFDEARAKVISEETQEDRDVATRAWQRGVEEARYGR